MSDTLRPEPPERRAWRTDAEWQRLRERIDGSELDTASPRWSHGRWWLTAAAAIIVVSLGLKSYFARQHAPTVRTASTAAGERIAIHLADSSVVTLGPASTIRYVLTADRREVELVGLADFSVVHDRARPFIVRAKNAVTIDLGTEFVVRAYASDSSVQVAVTSGSVSLSGADTSRAVKLRPGNLGRVGADGVALPAPNGDAAARAAWVDGRLVFDDEPLSDVVAELSRWFDVEIHVPAESLTRRRVSAVYNSPSLAGVLDGLAATLDARYERAGRVVTILPRNR